MSRPSDLSPQNARERLEAHGQGHVLRFWDQLDEEQRAGLLRQIDQLDFAAIKRMRALLNASGEHGTTGTIEPAPVELLEGAERDGAGAAGAQSIREGNVGVVVVAGGQGSRLGYDGPKGAYRIGPLSDAPLFQIHAHKILALEKKHDAAIPFYVMTSQANDAATRAFFDEHDYFGLARERVLFFAQGMWPALNPQGAIILDRPDHIFMSPDGHGGIVAALQKEGMLDDMRARGVRTLFYFQVDNPMVEIADPVFVGFHESRDCEISIKVCAKRDADEPIGVVVVRDGRHAVVEYTELTDGQKNEQAPDGRLKFLYGSVAIHIFSRGFLELQAAADLPLHLAHKKVPYCDDSGETLGPDQPNAYKFEKFIFDAIPNAERTANLVFAREDEFSPVKNSEGEDSPATARQDMMLKHARWLETCGIAIPRTPTGELAHRIEIEPLHALGPEELRDRLVPGFEIGGDLLLS